MTGNNVYKSICAVQTALSKQGVAKDQSNKQQGFKYRGIDDIYNALAPILSENQLCILPKMLSRDTTERPSKSGGVLFYTTIMVEYEIVSAEDGSRHTVSAYGEAMDSGDKSVGKAMSYAYKAMAFQTFCIPTEGDNDADATTHDVKPKTQAPPSEEEDPADMVDRIMNTSVAKNPMVDQSADPKKQCPFCATWHTGQYPKCIACFKKEKNGETLVKTKTIVNTDAPPF